jgi:hypothetical protein
MADIGLLQMLPEEPAQYSTGIMGCTDGDGKAGLFSCSVYMSHHLEIETLSPDLLGH